MSDYKNLFADPLNIVSFAALFLALIFFCYMAFIRTAEINRNHLDYIAKEAEKELALLSETKEKKIAEEKAKKNAESSQDSSPKKAGLIDDVPMLLEKINTEAIGSGMELINIEKLDKTTYKLNAYAQFYRLINFIFKIEQANLAVTQIGIKPFSAQNDRITMTLKVVGDEMSEANKILLDNFDKASKESFRNPFLRDPGAMQAVEQPDVIDLTWKFKLSGIGEDHRGRYANIDHKTYYKNNEFNGMKIFEIQKDRVELLSGSQKFSISFRYKKPLL